MDFVSHVNERIHDEFRRKMVNRIIDQIIDNWETLFDKEAALEQVSRMNRGERTDPAKLMSTKAYKLPRDALPRLVGDATPTVSLYLSPFWSNDTFISGGAKASTEDNSARFIHKIQLKLPTKLLGLAGDPLTARRQVTGGSMGDPGDNWQLKMVAKAMVSPEIWAKIPDFLKMGRSVLYHEITHLLDTVEYYKTYKKDAEASRNYPNVSGIDKDAPDSKVNAVRRAYFNHPIEYNAFFSAALNDILQWFDEDGISKKIIQTWTQAQFVKTCLERLPLISPNYKTMGLISKNREKVIRRFATYYTDVLIPKYRDRGRESFATKTQKMTPEIKTTIDRMKQTRAESAALAAKKAKKAEAAKHARDAKWKKGEAVPTTLEGPERYGFNGLTRDKAKTPEGAFINDKGKVQWEGHNGRIFMADKHGIVGVFRNGIKIETTNVRDLLDNLHLKSPSQ
jgi:hypothetical protein